MLPGRLVYCELGLATSICCGDQHAFAACQNIDYGKALHGKGFINGVKQRPDVHLLRVTHDNRNHLLAEIFG